MTLEVQLRRTLDTLAEAVREDVGRRIAGIVDELVAAAAADRRAAAEEAADRIRTELERASDEKLARLRADADETLARAKADGDAALTRAKADADERLARAAADAEEQLARARTAADEQLARATAAAERDADARAVAARTEGESHGREQGRREGLDEGRQAGWNEGWELGRQQGFVDGQREGEEKARTVRLAETARDRARWRRLFDALSALDGGQSLSQILNTLADCAARESARAGVFLVQGDALVRWRFTGGDAADVGPTAYPIDHAGLVARAIRSGQPARDTSQSPGATPTMIEFAPGRRLLSLPVVVGGRIVAAVYADKEIARSDAGAEPGDEDAQLAAEHWETMLGVLVRHASRCLEALTALRTAQASTGAKSATTLGRLDRLLNEAERSWQGEP
jgi:hypothetical protein